jgi:tetratricopeptide (TPR) repeat protein
VPHLYLGLAHYERREFPKAKLHLSKAGDLALENPEVLPAVVDSWLSLNDSTILAHAIGFSARSNDVTATQLAAVLNRHGQYQATVRVLENRSSLDAGGFSLLAEAWDKQGQPERAFALLAKMIDAHPDQEQGYTTLAAFASAHQNDPYALKVLEQGLARHPGSAVLLIQRGLLLAIRGDREPAKESLRAAAAAKPDWTLPLIALAILDLEEGRPAQAVEALRRAITVAPGDAQGYYFCAMALNRSGEPDQAITMLRKALTIAPDNAQARVLLGQLLITQGSLRQGVGELEAVIKSDRKNARALYQLALAYRKLGQPALSEKYMSEFKALKKDLDDEKALVQILKVVQ